MPCLSAVENIRKAAFDNDPSGQGGLYVAAEQLERRVHTAVDGMDELILLRDISVDCLMDADRAGELILQS